MVSGCSRANNLHIELRFAFPLREVVELAPALVSWRACEAIVAGDGVPPVVVHLGRHTTPALPWRIRLRLRGCRRGRGTPQPRQWAWRRRRPGRGRPGGVLRSLRALVSVGRGLPISVASCAWVMPCMSRSAFHARISSMGVSCRRSVFSVSAQVAAWTSVYSLISSGMPGWVQRGSWVAMRAAMASRRRWPTPISYRPGVTVRAMGRWSSPLRAMDSIRSLRAWTAASGGSVWTLPRLPRVVVDGIGAGEHDSWRLGHEGEGGHSRSPTGFVWWGSSRCSCCKSVGRTLLVIGFRLVRKPLLVQTRRELHTKLQSHWRTA